MKHVLAAALALLLLPACSFMEREPYRTTYYFDLLPSAEELHPDASFSSLSTSSALQFSDRMLFRVGPDQMQFDEYNRWLASPETILKRYLESSFAGASASKPALQVKILRFELDKRLKTASCEVVASVLNSKGQLLKAEKLSSVAPVKGSSAQDYANAMHEAIAGLASQIAALLKANS